MKPTNPPQTTQETLTNPSTTPEQFAEALSATSGLQFEFDDDRFGGNNGPHFATPANDIVWLTNAEGDEAQGVAFNVWTRRLVIVYSETHDSANPDSPLGKIKALLTGLGARVVQSY